MGAHTAGSRQGAAAASSSSTTGAQQGPRSQGDKPGHHGMRPQDHHNGVHGAQGQGKTNDKHGGKDGQAGKAGQQPHSAGGASGSPKGMHGASAQTASAGAPQQHHGCGQPPKGMTSERPAMQNGHQSSSGTAQPGTGHQAGGAAQAGQGQGQPQNQAPKGAAPQGTSPQTAQTGGANDLAGKPAKNSQPSTSAGSGSGNAPAGGTPASVTSQGSSGQPHHASHQDPSDSRSAAPSSRADGQAQASQTGSATSAGSSANATATSAAGSQSAGSQASAGQAPSAKGDTASANGASAGGASAGAGASSTGASSTGETHEAAGNGAKDKAADASIKNWQSEGNTSSWPTNGGLSQKGTEALSQRAEAGGYGEHLFDPAAARQNGFDPGRTQYIAQGGLADPAKGIQGNSLAAVDFARQNNFQGVELNIGSTKDGQAFLWDGKTVGRQTGDPQNRELSALDSKELSKMSMSNLNPVTGERTPAYGLAGGTQKPESFQQTLDYVRANMAKNGKEASNIILNPNDRDSALNIVNMLSKPENADIRGNFGIKIHSDMLPSFGKDANSDLLKQLTAANEAAGKDASARLNLIPVLGNLKDLSQDGSRVTPQQGSEWLSGFSKLGNVSMAELSRTGNNQAMDDVLKAFRAANPDQKNLPISVTQRQEDFSVNGTPYAFNDRGQPTSMEKAPPQPFNSMSQYGNIVISNNPYVAMLSDRQATKGLDFAALGIDPRLGNGSINPATDLAGPPGFTGKPSWQDTAATV
ncbi:hypothetical protein ACFSE1_09400 [Rhizobium helianthi]|uniref:Uncharacterized protein n=1 Tax=Rhizobium helianthi TaxID=1132695 RepID=A0ABW4M2K0_9HYPH